MKKAFLSLFVLATCFSMSAQTKTVISGDYDGDGHITVGDVEYMAGIVLGKNQPLELQVADPYNGHEYVDLGVVVDGKPVYWATTNIGAELPADAGLYFAWGETMGYSGETNGEKDTYGYPIVSDGYKFDWAKYSSDLCSGSVDKIKKYCTDSTWGTVDYKIVLDPEDDAAHVIWQGAWRMPTKEDLDALDNQCIWTWVTMPNSEGEEINGYKVSNKSDPSKFIFLPVAGYRSNESLCNAGLHGYYWSSSLDANRSYLSCLLEFYSGYFDWTVDHRCFGLSIRPVCQ